MPVINVDPVKGGGYILPRHVFIRPSNGADIADGHVGHPSGDPRFGLVNGAPIAVQPLAAAVGIVTSGRV